MIDAGLERGSLAQIYGVTKQDYLGKCRDTLEGIPEFRTAAVVDHHDGGERFGGQRAHHVHQGSGWFVRGNHDRNPADGFLSAHLNRVAERTRLLRENGLLLG